MLEETLQISHAMFEGERGTEAAFDGPPVPGRRGCSTRRSRSRRPRVPIMVGGGGEKKTLRLVAQYADACNVFGTPEAIARKYAILDAHCAAVGRDPDEIERSTLQNVDAIRPTGRGRETPTGSSIGSASWPMPAPSTSSSALPNVARPAPAGAGRPGRAARSVRDL